MSGYKLQLVFVVICILVSAGVGASTSLFLRVLIDDEILPLLLLNNPDLSGLLRVVLTMLPIYGAGVFSAWLYNRMMVVVEQGTLKRIRDELFAHMQTLPISYFDTHSHGDVMSRYTNDTDTLRMAISQSFPQMLSAIFSTISAFGAMLFLSFDLAAFVAVFSVLLFTLVRAIVRRSAKYFIRQQRSLGDVNGFIEEMINGQKVIKVFNHERKAEALFREKATDLGDTAAQAIKYGTITMPVIGSMGYLLYALLGIVGGLIGILGIPNFRFTGPEAMTVGTVISFITLSRGFVNPIGQISLQFNMVVQALAGASRIFDLMDEESEQDRGYVTLVRIKTVAGKTQECDSQSGLWAWKHPHGDGTTTYTELKGDIHFFDVDFSYDGKHSVLQGINLYAKPGQKVALVGATGAGKTTITNLINRFYDLADGKVRYDGININKIRKSDLRRSLGVVLQDVNLFTGTVMDNIRYGKLSASDEECVRAAELANADGFIRMLPKGYHTVLEGDGSGLSQGQRQLISIARAAVADPPVMILDEATSSIDTRTEAIVQKGMDALMVGRTVFVIAHRLSTVQNADVIMVLEDGRIIERGSHDQLIAAGGKYYQLYTGAFELE